MSLPTGSVPNRWPERNGLMFELRMSPPVGLPTVPNSGHTKKRKSRNSRIPPGIAMSSWRVQPRRGLTSSAPADGSASEGTCASASGSCAAIADPRVEDGVEQVGDQVGQDDDDSEHEDDPLHDED